MDIDEAIDLLIPEINREVTFDFKSLFGTVLKTTDLKYLIKVRIEMEDKGLIDRINPKPGYENLYKMKGLVNDIMKVGSWTKYKTQMDNDKKEIPKIKVTVLGTGNNTAVSLGDSPINQESDLREESFEKRKITYESNSPATNDNNINWNKIAAVTGLIALIIAIFFGIIELLT